MSGRTMTRWMVMVTLARALLALCVLGRASANRGPEHARVARSATICDAATAASFSTPRLQVPRDT